MAANAWSDLVFVYHHQFYNTQSLLTKFIHIMHISYLWLTVKSLKTAIFHLSQTENITCAQGCVLGQHFQGTLRTRPVVFKAKVPRSRGQGLEASHWSSRPRCQGLEAKVSRPASGLQGQGAKVSRPRSMPVIFVMKDYQAWVAQKVWNHRLTAARTMFITVSMDV